MTASRGHLVVSLARKSDSGIGIRADAGCGFTRTGCAIGVGLFALPT